MGRPKKQQEDVLCPLCGEKMEMEPYNINIETMTSIAGWHLDFQPRMKICHSCAHTLLNYIRAWYAKTNKTNKYNKFG